MCRKGTCLTKTTQTKIKSVTEVNEILTDILFGKRPDCGE